ncbi:ClpXP protease specificity-enhancing factor [Lysobacteraceae bacterium NML07-0707]|nr:ClpXP protease specificity-enhancing factor [Xanthomonadaceae bacterium NML07-0707]
MSDMPEMSSQRPYLLRAMHEWISDNGMTPYLLVNANFKGVHVPPHTIKDGQVVLNIAERAVHMLSLGNEYITFNARFGGVSHEVFVPVAAVLAIYARETGQGMGLPPDLDVSDESEVDIGVSSSATDDKSAAATKLVSVPSDDDGGDEPPSNSPASPPRRGHLRVIK